MALAPGVFVGQPDDSTSEGAVTLMNNEREGINATYLGDEENAMCAGGECAQRIDDMPTADELVQRIMNEASDILEALPKRFLG